MYKARQESACCTHDIQLSAGHPTGVCVCVCVPARRPHSTSSTKEPGLKCHDLPAAPRPPSLSLACVCGVWRGDAVTKGIPLVYACVCTDKPAVVAETKGTGCAKRQATVGIQEALTRQGLLVVAHHPAPPLPNSHKVSQAFKLQTF